MDPIMDSYICSANASNKGGLSFFATFEFVSNQIWKQCRVSEIRPEMSSKPLEIRVLKKWRPYMPNDQKNANLWFPFVDIHGDMRLRPCAFQVSKDDTYFDPLLEVQKCYRISGYVSKAGRAYMPMVPHQASLNLKETSHHELLHDVNIPNFYYNLANFEDLPDRKKHPKLLTGFVVGFICYWACWCFAGLWLFWAC